MSILSRSALSDILAREGDAYEFVQVIRLLQRMYPEKDAIGEWADPSNEALRIRVSPSFGFPLSEVSYVEFAALDKTETGSAASATRTAASTGPAASVGTRFFGLIGSQGVLPHVYTQHAISRSRVRDTAFRDFLDLFHHRLLSLFYRGWERHHPAIAAERGSEDRVLSHLLDLVGVGTEAARKQSGLHTGILAYYAGLLAMRSRPAVGFAQIVSDCFDVRAEVGQFAGEWRRLHDGGQLCIDDDGPDGTLGSAVVGDAVYDPHGRVVLRMGPLRRTEFDSFLPTGSQYEVLKSLAGFYFDEAVGVDVQLVLMQNESPSTVLADGASPTLGFGTWLRNKAPQGNPDDVKFRLC